MTDAALLEAVRQAVRDEVEQLRRALEQLHRERDTPMQRVMQALVELYGAGVPFTSADFVEALQLPVSSRDELREAVHVVLAGKAATSERVGKLMRRLVDAGEVHAGCRLLSPTSEGNKRLWLLERVAR